MSGTWPLARAAIVAQLTGVTTPAEYTFSYDGESGGPFQVGETLTFLGGETATLIALTDAGTTGSMTVRMLTGSMPVDNDTIAGGTSMAAAAVNGTPSGVPGETLQAYEWAPGRQAIGRFPYAFPVPVEVAANRYPGQMRELLIDVGVRVMLSGIGEDDMERLHQRYDAWWTALLDAWDDAATLDGAADISVQQGFSGLLQYEDIERGWGFDMTLGAVRITEVKTFSA